LRRTLEVTASGNAASPPYCLRPLGRGLGSHGDRGTNSSRRFSAAHERARRDPPTPVGVSPPLEQEHLRPAEAPTRM
jgi:hypothetical protein